ncbi:uncharacterized protein LOC134811815 [Bolinopsis microptera]|uniref:uncharacterized protein LOC134811815 n=1 Tax=Bolinopsis microptera TaxID=2820187 RepID=UPI003079261F
MLLFVALSLALHLANAGYWGRCMYRDKYLSGYSDITIGTAWFDTLYDAESECPRRPDCGGITYETYSNKYTLRKGSELKASPSNEISWKMNPYIQYNGKYLSGYSNGQAKFDTLSDAVAQCPQRSDCGGITYETYSGKYTLRKGSELKPSPANAISWKMTPCEHGGKLMAWG